MSYKKTEFSSLKELLNNIPCSISTVELAKLCKVTKQAISSNKFRKNLNKDIIIEKDSKEYYYVISKYNDYNNIVLANKEFKNDIKKKEDTINYDDNSYKNDISMYDAKTQKTINESLLLQIKIYEYLGEVIHKNEIEKWFSQFIEEFKSDKEIDNFIEDLTSSLNIDIFKMNILRDKLISYEKNKLKRVVSFLYEKKLRI